MDKLKANKIIAKFMGFDLSYNKYGLYLFEGGDYKQIPEGIYSDSFNALIPVWEKLGIATYFEFNLHQPWFSLSLSCGKKMKEWREESVETNTVQEAAAIATAKTILELKEGKEDDR